MELTEVDGSLGEGGGQILRTAVAFSAILGRGVRVINIRAGREVPGLKRQHVSALRVIASVFGGELAGAEEGSSEVVFSPGTPRSGSLTMDMKTAASIPLVLQAVVPAVALSRSSLTLELKGGTDVPWSPTADYMKFVALSAYRAVGVSADLRIRRRGYYPRGGGALVAVIEPSPGVRAVHLDSPSSVTKARVLSRASSLPRHVAERQLSAAESELEARGIEIEKAELESDESDSPGSATLAFYADESAILGGDAIGARGKPAEEVGTEAARMFAAAAGTRAGLDSHCADMVIPLLSFAPGPSRIRIPAVTPHLSSGLALAKLFTSCDFSFEGDRSSTVVTVNPSLGTISQHNV